MLIFILSFGIGLFMLSWWKGSEKFKKKKNLKLDQNNKMCLLWKELQLFEL